MDYTQCYCQECLYAGTSPFGHLVCQKDCTKIIGWWQRACKDFKDRYEETTNNENE